jgi:hypothetical protein
MVLNKVNYFEMTTPAEKLRLVKMYGTITSVDGKWIFKADPQKTCEKREITHESRWTLIEIVYDNLRGIKIW